MKKQIFGRTNETGSVDILYIESGEPVIVFDNTMPIAWPVDSDLSAYYEHPNGIVLTKQDTKELGIEIE